MVRLRPHHLLCLLTYVGKGYTPAFTANMTVIAGRISAGEAINVVDGPDDICAPLLDEHEPHCHRSTVMERDAQAAEDVGRLLKIPVQLGSRLVLGASHLRFLRAAFKTDQIRSACTGCNWSELCRTIAAEGYGGAIL